MEGCRVSVVVPVHNAAAYLPQTMGNLFFQTMFELDPPGQIEIILVNDVSTDESWGMLLGLKEQYPDRVRLIDLPEHRGAGGARNAGMDAARGEYIAFMDADDFLDASLYEKLYAAASSGFAGYDIVDSPVLDEADRTSALYIKPDCWGVLNDAQRARLIASPGFLFTRLYRRAFLQENGIRFRERVKIEDVDFLQEVFAKAQTAYGITEALYLYKDNEASASKENIAVDYFDFSLAHIVSAYERISVLPNYEGLREGLEGFFIKTCATILYILELFVRVGRFTRSERAGVLQRTREVYRRTVQGPAEGNAYAKQLATPEELAQVKRLLERADAGAE